MGRFIIYKKRGFIMNILLEFIIVFIILYIVNFLFFGLKNKKLNIKKLSPEITYLIKLYQIDIKKINYQKLIRTCVLINTIIMSTIYIIVTTLIKSFLFQLLIGFVLLILMIIICYGLLGRYYKKRGNDDV